MRRITITLSILGALALVPGTAGAVKPTKADKQNAAKQCKELRSGMGVDAFRQLYGTNKTGKNAGGKCVARFARDEARERKAAKSNAAKDCKAERAEDTDAFRETYGSGKAGRNAYGKCVSMKARENKDAFDEADEERGELVVNAARQCRAEQKADSDAFDEEYGTRRNAFGKCVSQTAREQKNAEETEENGDTEEDGGTDE